MPSGVYKRTKEHKVDCQCFCCRAKRGEYKGKNNSMFGKGYLITGQNNGMYTEKVPVICQYCGNIIYLLPCHAKKRKFCSDECRYAVGVWNKGLTKETDERVAEYGKKGSVSRKDKSGNNKGKHWKIKDTSKWKGNQNAKGHEMSIEGKKRWLLKMKKVYRNTSIEIAINNELIQRDFIENIDYFKNEPLCNRFNVDFYFPSQNLVIECDGDYWHNREDVKARDKIKNKILTEQKYLLYRFWEYEINNSAKKCIDSIIELN